MIIKQKKSLVILLLKILFIFNIFSVNFTNESNNLKNDSLGFKKDESYIIQNDTNSDIAEIDNCSQSTSETIKYDQTKRVEKFQDLIKEEEEEKKENEEKETKKKQVDELINEIQDLKKKEEATEELEAVKIFKNNELLGLIQIKKQEKDLKSTENNRYPTEDNIYPREIMRDLHLYQQLYLSDKVFIPIKKMQSNLLIKQFIENYKSLPLITQLNNQYFFTFYFLSEQFFNEYPNLKEFTRIIAFMMKNNLFKENKDKNNQYYIKYHQNLEYYQLTHDKDKFNNFVFKLCDNNQTIKIKYKNYKDKNDNILHHLFDLYYNYNKKSYTISYLTGINKQQNIKYLDNNGIFQIDILNFNLKYFTKTSLVCYFKHYKNNLWFQKTLEKDKTTTQIYDFHLDLTMPSLLLKTLFNFSEIIPEFQTPYDNKNDFIIPMERTEELNKFIVNNDQNNDFFNGLKNNTIVLNSNFLQYEQIIKDLLNYFEFYDLSQIKQKKIKNSDDLIKNFKNGNDIYQLNDPKFSDYYFQIIEKNDNNFITIEIKLLKKDHDISYKDYLSIFYNIDNHKNIINKCISFHCQHNNIFFHIDEKNLFNQIEIRPFNLSLDLIKKQLIYNNNLLNEKKLLGCISNETLESLDTIKKFIENIFPSLQFVTLNKEIYIDYSILDFFKKYIEIIKYIYPSLYFDNLSTLLDQNYILKKKNNISIKLNNYKNFFFNIISNTNDKTIKEIKIYESILMETTDICNYIFDILYNSKEKQIIIIYNINKNLKIQIKFDINTKKLIINYIDKNNKLIYKYDNQCLNYPKSKYNPIQKLQTMLNEIYNIDQYK